MAVIHDTGERMIPESSADETLWEHLYRYKFAKQYVSGRRVLDIACGEGYGTSGLLSSGAASVIGVDISEEACEHARKKYSIDARPGDAAAIPLPDRSIDVVVSFETIEHIKEPTQFIRECVRVLTPSGLLIVSTPNVDAYNPNRDPAHNPFHCSEMTGSEFTNLIAGHFQSHELFAQVPITAPFFSTTGLVARKAQWNYVRGYHRFISSRFPSSDPERESRARTNPVEEILRRESWLGRKVNPFTVRPHRLGKRVVPLYFIAVASGPIPPK